MRAILRASDSSSLLWIDRGERFELPDLTDPDVRAARQREQAARSAARAAPKQAAGQSPPRPKASPERSGPSARPPAGGGAAAEELDLDDKATDEVPRASILRLVKPPAVAQVSPDSLPPLGALERARAETPPEAPARPFVRCDDEMSTGLFEPMGWDEADPWSGVHDSEFPAVAPSGPHLSIVVAPGVDDDFDGLVAEPLPAPPRPRGAEIEPPRPRPVAEIPDWYEPEANGTAIVLDPTRPVAPPRLGDAPEWTFWRCVAVDAAAWFAGFLFTFGLGTVTSVAALGVVVINA